MEPQFVVVDEYGEGLRAFYTRESAEAFVKLRPECKISEPHVMSQEEFDALFGDPPF